MHRPAHPRLPVAPLSMAIGLAAALASVGAPAATYRWVDEDGITVYSQTPPPQAPATVLKPAPAPDPREIEEARQRLREQIEGDMDQREDRRAAAEKEQQVQAEAAALKTKCENARKNLETVRDLGARRLMTPDGQFHRLSPEERVKAMDLAQKEIEESCK